ncbi:hypothetical protein BEN48_02315 [Hymenobacter glacialis]|uniref:SbsA Ig-like domain-containing protein n=2 Tax=Hymenobacter glacialis TaxID=1908236 RepID=A0A1G1T145_9BACT|nr:hypothetical protein BEN48_02315 [Hymenobacter glacialis]
MGPVAVSFNQPVAAGSTTALKIFSAQRGGLRTGHSGTTTSSGSTVSFAPAYAFRPGETVQATLTTAATAAGGRLATPRVFQFTAAATNGSGTFAGGSDVAVADSPISVAVGDVDGDGDLDLLTAHYPFGPGTRTVGVRLNNGSGTFAGASDVAVGNSPGSVVLGDVDGDGDLDLLTANDVDNTVSVRLNNGSGTFAGGSDVAVGNGPYSVVLGDVDGDGDLDLLTANYYSNTVSVRLNNGSGTFAGDSDVALGNGPGSVVLGDVDGDGDLDLLTANSGSNTVSVRLNNGSGTFAGGSDVAVDKSPISVVLGDVDGDGDLDVIAASFTNTVSVRLNQKTVLALAGRLLPTQVVLYPNPTCAAAAVRVEFPVSGGAAASVTVFNMLGQEMRKAWLPVYDGRAGGVLSTAGLAAGAYVLRMQAGSVAVIKFLEVN